jgi:hypothetical protein
MRHLLILLPVLFCLGASAQHEHVMIADHTVLNDAMPVRKSHGAEASLQAAGFTAEEQVLVLQYGDPEQWPEGIRVDSLRARNAPYIQNYVCYRVAEFPEDSVKKVILMVPAKENIHMPESMRPLADFYLLVPERSISEVNTGKQRPSISRGPQWKNLRRAKILKPEELYATYDLAGDSLALAALRSRGMSQAEIDAVVFRSIDRNWPDGIDTFEERQKFVADFVKYKAYFAARWNDKVLLIIPVEKNRKQPVLMRPFVDLYFVYNANAVEIKKK